MTLTNIWDRVRAVIRDSNKAFIPDSEITAWVNDAQLDIASRCENIRESVTSTIPAAQTVPLPSDFLRAVTLRLGTDDDVEFVDDDVYDSWFDSGDEPDHTLGRVYGTAIELYPKPAVGTAYTLRSIASPASLSAGGDIPEIPTEMHLKLVYYAQAQAKYKESEVSEGDRYYALYDEGLPRPTTGVRKWVPGPLAMTFDPGPFDIFDGQDAPRHV